MVCEVYRHAKRTTVSTEDVKLSCRRSQSLLDLITARGDKLRAEKDKGGGGACAERGGDENEEGGTLEGARGNDVQVVTEKKSRGRTRHKP